MLLRGYFKMENKYTIYTIKQKLALEFNEKIKILKLKFESLSDEDKRKFQNGKK